MSEKWCLNICRQVSVTETETFFKRFRSVSAVWASETNESHLRTMSVNTWTREHVNTWTREHVNTFRSTCFWRSRIRRSAGREEEEELSVHEPEETRQRWVIGWLIGSVERELFRLALQTGGGGGVYPERGEVKGQIQWGSVCDVDQTFGLFSSWVTWIKVLSSSSDEFNFVFVLLQSKRSSPDWILTGTGSASATGQRSTVMESHAAQQSGLSWDQ